MNMPAGGWGKRRPALVVMPPDGPPSWGAGTFLAVWQSGPGRWRCAFPTEDATTQALAYIGTMVGLALAHALHDAGVDEVAARALIVQAVDAGMADVFEPAGGRR